ncbi:hypothetical protein [Bacillus mycoides]|uniref:hypothetical protein n=1 Tax=Bacillus mycoides TaxID=1405 RepID=UPI003A81227F
MPVTEFINVVLSTVVHEIILVEKYCEKWFDAKRYKLDSESGGIVEIEDWQEER